jgi:hypothetical protein
MSVFEPKTKNIDGLEIKVVPFNAMEALKLKATLVRKFGPALGQATGAFTLKAAEDVEINGPALAKAIQLLFEELSESEFDGLIRRMLTNVTATKKIDGKDATFDFNSDFDAKMNLVFQGQLLSIYPVMLFVLEVNFPDFFGKAAVIGGRLKGMMRLNAAGGSASGS